MKNKLFWLILALTVGGLIAVFAFSAGRDNQPGSTADTTNVNQELFPDDNVLGDKNAKNTLVEYGDLQCPACPSFAPMVNRLADDFKDELRIVFRHFPLGSIHPNAFSAARAAEAAGVQGKFFDMVDLLYERQEQWASSSNAVGVFREYAQQLGLDIEQFNQSYNSQDSTTRINRDVGIGNDLGVNSTPTFYLNGQKIENPRSYGDFRSLVEKAVQ